MNDLALESSSRPAPPPGDFGIEVLGDRAHLPSSVADSLSRLVIRSASELVAMVDSFPSAVAQALDWTVEDVRVARARLAETLQGHLSDRLLFPSPRPRPGMGARDPRSFR